MPEIQWLGHYIEASRQHDSAAIQHFEHAPKSLLASDMGTFADDGGNPAGCEVMFGLPCGTG
jgi:hypothetical protein